MELSHQGKNTNVYPKDIFSHKNNKVVNDKSLSVNDTIIADKKQSPF